MKDTWLNDETYKGNRIMFLKTKVDNDKPFVMAIHEDSHVDIGGGDTKAEAFRDAKRNINDEIRMGK